MQLSRLVARMLQSYWRLTRGLKLGAEACVVDGADRVMLVKSPDQNGWFLPCGIVRSGETLDDALRRCLRTEHGIEVKSKPKLFWIYTEEGGSRCQQTGLFIIEQWKQVTPSSPITAAFFRLDGLPADIDPQTAARISHIIEGHTPSEVC